MTATGAALHSSRDLDAFLRMALDRGRASMAATPKADMQTVRFGRQGGFRFAESAPFLAPNVALCMDTGDGPVPNTIYADYSGWHLSDGFVGLLNRPETLTEFDAHLAPQGLRAIYSEERGAWDIFDTSDGFGIRLQNGIEGAAEWEHTAPLAYFCKWTSEAQGHTMVHAASIAWQGKGALLIGEGGAGKSGTTLGAMLNGFDSAGDDYTLLSGGPPYTAYSLYRTFKQSSEGMARLGLPKSMPLNWQGKAVFRPETVCGRPIAGATPIHALLMPEIGAHSTMIEPMAPAPLFKQMTISTLRQISGNFADVFRYCAELVRELPCYRLRLSPDNDEITLVLKKFLEGLEC